jgi:amino acid transporter
VAVSISSGLAAVASAIPPLHSAFVPIGLALIAFLVAANLRGVRQAGALFAAPTYAFIVAIALLVIVGLIDAGRRGFHALPPPALHASQAVTLLLVLRAFASGSTAMTGIEAIFNAVPAFNPVEWRNARSTLTWMVGLLIAMFTAIIVLVHLDRIVPESSQTVLSQLAHLDFGSGPLYVYTQAATALVLLLAADTPYNDFPRVMFLLARDPLRANAVPQDGRSARLQRRDLRPVDRGDAGHSGPATTRARAALEGCRHERSVPRLEERSAANARRDGASSPSCRARATASARPWASSFA